MKNNTHKVNSLNLENIIKNSTLTDEQSSLIIEMSEKMY